MNRKCLGVFLVSLLLATAFLNLGLSLPHAAADSPPDVYAGVDLAYGDVADAKALIDQVSSYSNLIIIGTSKITNNVTKLNETLQYAYDKGLSFISLTPDPRFGNRTEWFQWFNYAKNTWGNRLLGFYVFDEIGGRQLDQNQTFITSASDYVDAANQFENRVGKSLMSIVTSTFNSTYFPIFSSDYALYWFDYKAGYDVIFAELGWNYSQQLNIALDRGAATMQNKDWGAMILWKYTVPPYIESGGDLYNDLVLAYNNGAKYIAVFDANEGWTSGILQTEHFQALQMFWHDIQSNSGVNHQSDRTAYVLPNGFGFGFRGPDDKIWGLWEASDFGDLPHDLSVSVYDMLNTYGTSLDLVYDDDLQSSSISGYNQVIYWNANAPDVAPPTFPTPIPTPTLSPTNSPSPSPSPSLTSTPSMSSPSPTPSPSPTLSPTEQPTSSPDPPKAPLSINYVYALATGVATAVVAAVVFMFRKRR